MNLPSSNNGGVDLPVSSKKAPCSILRQGFRVLFFGRSKWFRYGVVLTIFALTANIFHRGGFGTFANMRYVIYKSPGNNDTKRSDDKSSVNSTTSGSAVQGSTGKSTCPTVSPKLVGLIKVSMTAPPVDLQVKDHPLVEQGGRFRPAECKSRHRVAIIVPFRGREAQLPIFLYNLHPVLQRQQIDYAIYVVEQAGNGTFNKGLLMNVGTVEALKIYNYQCFIFHDIDLLPENDRNIYACPDQPRHMSGEVNTLRYTIPAPEFVGGVLAMSVDHFKAVNGYSNKFLGWGGEDDDMGNRIVSSGLFVTRYPPNIGRYTMIKHKKSKPSPHRFENVEKGRTRYREDGLNSMNYKTLDIQFRPLYTWVYVDVYPS